MRGGHRPAVVLSISKPREAATMFLALLRRKPVELHVTGYHLCGRGSGGGPPHRRSASNRAEVTRFDPFIRHWAEKRIVATRAAPGGSASSANRLASG